MTGEGETVDDSKHRALVVQARASRGRLRLSSMEGSAAVLRNGTRQMEGSA